MRVVIYSSDLMDRKRIREVFGKMFTELPLSICDNLQDLSRRLIGPAYEFQVAVLFAADNQELSLFLDLREQLSFSKLILVAPDQDEATLTNAHKLRPRFLSFSRNDLSDVMSVLSKMLHGSRYSTPTTQTKH